MKTLYKIIYDQLNTFKKHPINSKTIIHIYWLTNMACKIVYVDNHYHIGNQKQLQYLVHIYNSVITSKIVDLENYVAYQNRFRKSTSTASSFVNSTTFDMITINTIRNIFNIFSQQTGIHINLVNIPRMNINGMSI